MFQTINPDYTITVQIECFNKLPKNDKYLAWIKEPEYKGIIVQSDSISDCFEELSKSLKAIELYKENISKK